MESKTIEKLKAVLCDPEGTACFSDNKTDNEIVTECLKELEDDVESLQTVRSSLIFKSRIASLRQMRIHRLEMHVEKLKQLLLLTDPAVNEALMNDLTMRQWNEYTAWCIELEGVKHGI